MFTLEDCRAFYAQEIRFAATVVTPGLVEAYARVPREKFLGPAPWQISSPEAIVLSMAGLRESAYITVDDPRDLYHNVVVALDRAKDINNGQPSALARWIDALALQPGDRAFHLGCGVGYYTAIIAEVVGPSGSVVALELQSDLAVRAKKNLASYANVTVHQGDGAAFDPGPCDATFVNCGVTHPQKIWLERLRRRGRLVVPFTMAVNPQMGQGVMTKIVREPSGYSAAMVMPTGIFSGGSLRDPALEPLMKKAPATGGLLKLKSVRRDTHEPADTCFLHAAEVCLSTAPLSSSAVS
ncbi:MAG: methyltransferase domain-containing protein [Candidatus Acidiferrales bacterium]